MHLIVIFLIVGSAVWRLFGNLGTAPLERWDERVNAQVIGRSLISSTPWVLTEDSKPFFEKPPLWYYLSYIPVSVLGLTPAALRLVSASAGLLTVLLVVGFTAKRVGILPGLICAVSLFSARQLYVSNVAGYFSTHTLRSADADSLAVFFTAVSWVLLCEVSEKRIRLFYPAVIATALAILAKGPAAFLPWISWFAFYLIHKKQLPIPMRMIGKGMLAGFILLAPWYGYMTIRFGGDFLSSHILYHQIARFFTILEGHSGPWYFYLFLFLDPRVFPFGITAAISVLSVFLIKKLQSDIVAFTGAGSVLLMFVILSVAQTKLAWYILPIYPFAAVVLAKVAEFIRAEIFSERHKGKIVFPCL